MKRTLLFLGLLAAVVSVPVWTQSVSTKKEIAVFNLCYYDFTIPNGALGVVDDQIRNVFVNLGRFNVIGMTQRLAENDVNTFIQNIKAYKEQTLVIPESVSMGQEVFTDADFNKLTGAFIVVIPSVSYYNTELLDNARYEVTIRTSFSFIDISQSRTIGSATIETSAVDENPNEAIRMAADSVPSQLEYEIRKMEVFKLKTGIIDISGRDITIEFGRNMGVKVGDEYTIMTSRVTATGHQTEDETGLLLVREVREDYSIARLIYSDIRPVIGDQVKEVARFGVDASFYGTGMSSDTDLDLFAGLRLVSSRGFYSMRPAFDLEVPLMQSFSDGYFPINMFLGAEIMNLYLGRIQVAPSAAAGIGGAIALEENAAEPFLFSHAGAKAQLSLSYLINRNTKVFGTAGYELMLSLDSYFDTYKGLFVGGGISFKN